MKHDEEGKIIEEEKFYCLSCKPGGSRQLIPIDIKMDSFLTVDAYSLEPLILSLLTVETDFLEPLILKN